MSRTPTVNQYARLRPIAGGAALVLGSKREIEPLLRRGWVTAGEFRPPHYYWVRITADGLRALALAVERYGLPEFEHEKKRARG